MCVTNCSGTRKFSNFEDHACYAKCPSGVYETIYTDLNQLNQTVTYKCLKKCPSNKPREALIDGSVECNYECYAPQIFTLPNGSCASQCEAGQSASAGRRCVARCEDAQCYQWNETYKHYDCVDECATGYFRAEDDGRNVCAECELHTSVYVRVRGQMRQCYKGGCPARDGRQLFVVRTTLECVEACPGGLKVFENMCVEECPRYYRTYGGSAVCELERKKATWWAWLVLVLCLLVIALLLVLLLLKLRERTRRVDVPSDVQTRKFVSVSKSVVEKKNRKTRRKAKYNQTMVQQSRKPVHIKLQ